MAKKTRGRRLVWLHRWIGLTLALLLIAQAASGIMLLHRAAIEDWSRPAIAAVARPDLARVTAHLLEAMDGQTLDRITFAHSEDRAPSIRTLTPTGMQIAYANPANGTIGAAGSLWSDPAEAALVVHTTLTLGLSGFLIVALEGLLLAFLAISGLIVWWPAAGRLVQALRVRSRVGFRLFVFDLHKTAGAVIALFLILSGVTGALMIFEPLLKPLVAMALPVDADPAIGPASRPEAEWMSREAALQIALDRFPGAPLRQVRVAGEHQRIVVAIFDAPPSGLQSTHQLYGIDRDGGAVVMEHVAGHEAAGDALFEALLPLHNGSLAGVMGKWLMTVVGIGLLVLTLTGFVHFIMLRMQRRAAYRRR